MHSLLKYTKLLVYLRGSNMALILRPTITYPAALDTETTLPSVVDNATPVTGIVHNNLRAAVINIEYELGVKPSGQIYKTVRARLDALEGILARLNLNIQFGGDIEATELDPTIQHVIGINGNPIIHNSEIPTGSVLRWDGNYWNETNLYMDDILPPFVVGLNGPPMQEVNQCLDAPTFMSTYNFDPPTSITLTDSEGHSQIISIVDRALFYSNYDFQKTVFDGYVIFTVTATHHQTEKNTDYIVYWGQKLYWGVGPAGYTTASDIKNNLSGTITNTIAANFTVSAGPTEKIYFACRAAYGTATFYVGGFEGGFALVSDTISLTNDHGYTENYALYESDNLGLGSTTVTVS